MEFNVRTRRADVFVVLYTNIQWPGKSILVLTFFCSDTGCVVVKCHPKFFSYRCTIISNLCTGQFCFKHIGLFYDASIPGFIPRSSDWLCFFVGNFNHAPTYSLLAYSFISPGSHLSQGQCNLRRTNS